MPGGLVGDFLHDVEHGDFAHEEQDRRGVGVVAVGADGVGLGTGGVAEGKAEGWVGGHGGGCVCVILEGFLGL